MWHYLAGAHPGSVGVLLGPSYFSKVKLRHWMPFALDNDAFTLRDNWNEQAWIAMLDRVRLHRMDPIWVLVPDVVADKDRTIKRWYKYAPVAKRYGWPLAFALQDGMMPHDVPTEAEVVFVGGSTKWKWRTVPMWCEHFKRVHVGRVNELRRLEFCERYGAESCDGSGFFRDTEDGRKAQNLLAFVRGHRTDKHQLALIL